MTDASVTSVRKQLESLQTEAEITLAEAQAEYDISVLSAKSTYDTSMIDYNHADTVYSAQSATVTNEVKKLESEITVLQGEIEQVQDKLNDGDFWTSYKEAETAKDIYGYTISSLEEAVTSAENALTKARNNLEEFNTFVEDDNILYAPESGIITALNYETGDELVTTGTILSYSTGAEDTISVDVAEEDVPNIAVGDSVSIIFSAYPEENYNGTITAIETKTTDNHESTVNYPVTLLVEGDTEKLYGGMIADVTFAVESKENVLYVSRKAIVESEDGETGVYQKNSMGKMVLTPVETGFSDGANIEIVSGLSEGDTIYIASKVSAENAQNLESE